MNQPDQSVRVFVVHGRDLAARNALFDFLMAIGLHPIEWTQAQSLTGDAAPHISTVLDAAFSAAQAIVILLTPDEEVRLKSRFATGLNDPDTVLSGQARPNVLFEAGMAFGRHPKRTILASLGELRLFSDISGRLVIKLANSAAVRNDLVQRLRVAGCPVNTSGSRWLEAGDFDAVSRAHDQPEQELSNSRSPSSQDWTKSGQIRLRVDDPQLLGFGNTRVLGEAVNDGPVVQLVSITATFTNHDHAVVGIATGTVAQLGKGQSKRFTLLSNDDLSDYSQVAVQVDYVI